MPSLTHLASLKEPGEQPRGLGMVDFGQHVVILCWFLRNIQEEEELVPGLPQACSKLPRIFQKSSPYTLQSGVRGIPKLLARLWALT